MINAENIKIFKNEKAIKKLNLAKRYFENAKNLLKKAGIDENKILYIDIKYVSSASGAAYLSALEALKAIFIPKGKIDKEFIKRKIRYISIYQKILNELHIGKDKDILLNLLKSVYDILYLGGYYRELQNKKAIDAGFEAVEKIIKIVENYIKF